MPNPYPTHTYRIHKALDLARAAMPKSEVLPLEPIGRCFFTMAMISSSYDVYCNLYHDIMYNNNVIGPPDSVFDNPEYKTSTRLCLVHFELCRVCMRLIETRQWENIWGSAGKKSPQGGYKRVGVQSAG